MSGAALPAGRRALITGASRGIGAAIARALDAAGVHTMLVARDANALAAMAQSLTHAKTFAADLAIADAADRVAREATNALGGAIDILINNAGMFVVADIATTNDAAIDGQLALNVAAPMRLARAVLPGMIKRRAGHIITLGSVADRTVFASTAAYAATKHAVRALHEAMCADLRRTGVRATLMSPGPVDTPIWDPYDPDNRRGFMPRAQMLRAEDVADAVLWALTRPAHVNVDELRLMPA
ncbi:MAG TPA: SDR family NAD(P)-dependent oxidoreductase [Gemmatimonadaceae bacterium]|nr:SDR family NAD(P)-dependent oxidoreductase [Gemmatimonadaceae bacterium]